MKNRTVKAAIGTSLVGSVACVKGLLALKAASTVAISAAGAVLSR